jgi:hypothetical protein
LKKNIEYVPASTTEQMLLEMASNMSSCDGASGIEVLVIDLIFDLNSSQRKIA